MSTRHPAIHDGKYEVDHRSRRLIMVVSRPCHVVEDQRLPWLSEPVVIPCHSDSVDL